MKGSQASTDYAISRAAIGRVNNIHVSTPAPLALGVAGDMVTSKRFNRMPSLLTSIICIIAFVGIGIVCEAAYAAEGNVRARLETQSSLPGKLVLAESFEESASVPDGWT